MSVIIACALALFAFSIWLLFQSGEKKTINWVDAEREKVIKKKKIKFIEEAEALGVTINQDNFILFWVVVILISISASFVMLNPLIAVVVLVTAYFGQKIYISHEERKKRDKAKEQLGPALQNLGSAYRTLKNWQHAIDQIIPILDEPLRSEFTRARNSHASGVPIGKCFRDMMERLKVPEMSLFVIMANISEKVGADVAEGVLVAGSNFQTRRLLLADVRNALMNALSENRNLVFLFIGAILYFRFLQEEIFAGFTTTNLGRVLLAVFLGASILALIRSYYIIRKEL